MGFLRSLFGPSKGEIWGQIAKDIGGRFSEGGFFLLNFTKVGIAYTREWVYTTKRYLT